MKNTILISAIIALFITSCKNDVKQENTVVAEKPELKIKNAEWLIGSWGNTTAEGVLTENWKKVNDSVYHGESYFAVGKDTVFAESMVLDEIDGKMACTVTVPNQNDEKPVRFDLTSITDKEMIFENPKHDFPNKIVYTQVRPDSLVAVIYGVKKGKEASETFAMKKIQ
ncbi:hypothetical protein AM493_07530 [Flavobacterium akiainvivens]|uniref:DUF6265 domain-containing protein n=1 Tax=Flavobacterium akiainvivens TaxID=1202724 RepID=A0A0M8MGR1_9FLAO|nr:DUF6265 family protein [Flavobacterium akiainvivens]KOS05901.1 hypothetical protein AM493_07530 [Flavobacterium akiainvivens]SFQ56026.1 hypothetical protein SAMN05444144_10812 [Flavobacterium akiainvivens]